MGKPTNTKPNGCVATSSNCVIWQGPDLPGINLCTGDTVSEVVYKLAVKLCTLQQYTDVSAYDLSCLDVTDCVVGNFVEMLQYLIEQICLLKQVSPVSNNAPQELEFAVSTCFQGDGVIQSLEEYVHNIGKKVCDTVAQLSINTASMQQLNDRLNQQITRIDGLIG